MGLAKGIRKLGFVSWHERVLLASHGWLVLTLLSSIVAFAALEALMNSEAWTAQAKSAFVILAAGAVCVVTLHRFLQQLAHAQKASSQAVCAECEVFGQLAVVAEDRAETWVRVRCRNCSHEWVMDDR